MINIYDIEPAIIYQPTLNFNVSLTYKYSDKKNNLSLREHAFINNVTFESKYNVSQKGRLNAKFGYVYIIYNFLQNTSISYEMLEGLRAGKNITWSISYERTLLNNMQISINYEGRKSEGVKTINTATVQVRAFF